MIKGGGHGIRDPVQQNSSCWTKMEQFEEQNTKGHSDYNLEYKINICESKLLQISDK